MRNMIFCVLLITGCSTNNGRVVVDNISDVSEGKGIALFSTGAYDTSLAYATALMLVNGSNHKRYDAVQIILDSSYHETDIEGEHTIIRTLYLPVGKYYMTARALNPYITVTKSPSYEFDIVNTKVVYIGNYYIHGEELTWSLDKKDRDVAFFKKKNPRLDSISIESQHTPVPHDFEGFQTKGHIFGEP